MQTTLEIPCINLFLVGLLSNDVVKDPTLNAENNLDKLHFLHCESHVR